MLSLSLMCPIKIFFILLMLLSSYKANLILLVSKDKLNMKISFIFWTIFWYVMPMAIIVLLFHKFSHNVYYSYFFVSITNILLSFYYTMNVLSFIVIWKLSVVYIYCMMCSEWEKKQTRLCFFPSSYAHNTSDTTGVRFYTSSNYLRHQLDVLQFDSILTQFTRT